MRSLWYSYIVNNPDIFFEYLVALVVDRHYPILTIGCARLLAHETIKNKIIIRLSVL